VNARARPKTSPSPHTKALGKAASRHGCFDGPAISIPGFIGLSSSADEITNSNKLEN
jgi:hypothetical protein